MTRTVLVTGASTGIGRATAERLHRDGFEVFGGVRREADAEALRGLGIRPILLDVTDATHIEAAARTLHDHCGPRGVYGLVNNAGIAVAGPVEIVDLNALRRQLEVNVVGLIAVTQALLPLLRDARGRLVNVGSQGGRVTAPYVGVYTASKHALVALTNALRLELKPWRIQVAIIEPGAVSTPIWDKGREAVAHARTAPDPRMAALYPTAVDTMAGIVERQDAHGVPPETVAAAIHHALTARRARTRYVVGTDAKIGTTLVRLLPDRLMDRLILATRGS